MLTAEDVKLVSDWRAAKAQLQQVQESERQLRANIVEKFFANKKLGVNNFDVGYGAELKLTHNLNYKLDQDNIEKALDEIERLGPEGQFLAERLVKVEFKLSVSEYKKLDLANPVQAKIKALLDVVITTSDASPALEFKQ